LRNESLLVILEQIILYGPRGDFELWHDMPTYSHKTLSLSLSSILEVAMIANISITALLLQKFLIPWQRYLKPRQFSTGGFDFIL
jgi:hypothetical protein